jgi:2-dehydropantoate 2-reductase
MIRIAVLGGGAVGGYFAAHLARAGADVHVIARGANLEAIRRGGITLVGPRGEINVRPNGATSDPADIGYADLVLFAVKTYQTLEAGRILRPILSKNSVVVSLQNGPDRGIALARVVEPAIAVDGLCYVSALTAAPGVVRYTSSMSSMVIGFPVDGHAKKTLSEFSSQFGGHGFDINLSSTIGVEVWSKLVLLSTNFIMTGLARAPAGVVYKDSRLAAIAASCMAEVAVVANASGVALPNDVVERSIRQAASFPQDMYASIYHDLEAGRPLELEEVCGAIAKIGARHGVPTPVHDLGLAFLGPHANGRSCGVSP